MSSRVSRFASLALIVAAVGAASASTNDLDVARQALRDGFWALARTRASAQAQATNACAEARQIVLESWAKENKWGEISQTLKSWGDPTGDVFAYYRALALSKTGQPQAAEDLLSGTKCGDPAYARLTARLLADLALTRGDPAKAVKAYEGVASPGPDDRIQLAEAYRRLGEAKQAARYWREVLADTNASPRAAVTAAANLGDEKGLRHAVSNDIPADVRLIARLRLGTVLLSRAGGFDEGAKLIRAAAIESPDAEGALEAARTLAAARLSRRDWSGAARGYTEILEIWPAAARIESVQEGLGWALLNGGRAEDALQAFRRAEECATSDDDHAAAAAKAADALAALGRIDESTEKCREVLKRWPKTEVAKRLTSVVRLRELESAGRVLYGKFRFAEAQKAFREVAEGDAARRGRMTFLEILCLYGQGRDDEAERQARALGKSSDDPRLKADVTEWLAKHAYNNGRWREAQDLFRTFAVSPTVRPEDAAQARVWAARAALAANDFEVAISNAADVVAGTAPVAARAAAQIVQGEALLELARFDEAVLVLERAAAVPEISPEMRLEAQIRRADALYAVGADNPVRYEEALSAYRSIGQSETVSEESRLRLAYKIGVTLEKLKRRDEAVEQYYTHVVLAYRAAREAGRPLDDESQAVFARAGFRLADLCEASGHFLQASKTLELVAESDVPAAAEAAKRLSRLRQKGILP